MTERWWRYCNSIRSQPMFDETLTEWQRPAKHHITTAAARSSTLTRPALSYVQWRRVGSSWVGSAAVMRTCQRAALNLWSPGRYRSRLGLKSIFRARGHAVTGRLHLLRTQQLEALSSDIPYVPVSQSASVLSATVRQLTVFSSVHAVKKILQIILHLKFSVHKHNFLQREPAMILAIQNPRFIIIIIIYSFIKMQHKMTMFNWRTGHARLGRSS